MKKKVDTLIYFNYLSDNAFDLYLLVYLSLKYPCVSNLCLKFRKLLIINIYILNLLYSTVNIFISYNISFF